MASVRRATSMDHLTSHEAPSVKTGHLITAFRGWPDAGEGASSAIRYLLRKLPAKKFAELDPEEFYDFAHVRPSTSITKEGNRIVKWPANEFYYWAADDPSHSLMLFLGVEPSLKWKTFSRAILDVAEENGVKAVVHIGALLDAVPHARAVRLTGGANGEGMKQALRKYNIGSSNYQGPTGITSAVMEACTERGMSFTTLWAHTPHYLQAAPNYRVSHALVSNLSGIVGVDVPLDELRSAGDTFDREVEKAVSKDSQIGEYVRKLEQRYDEMVLMTQDEMPPPEDVVRDLEDFLKEQRRNGEEDSDS